MNKKQTPFIATDEANTPNLMGNRRLIWVKNVSNFHGSPSIF